MLAKQRSNNVLLFAISFFSFLGYYTSLLILFSLGMSQASRNITIPVRIFIVISLLLLFIKNIEKSKIIWQVKCFLFFSLFYICRIGADYNYGKYYYLPYPELLFLFISFSVVPFLSLSVFKLKSLNLSAIIKAIFISGATFSILCVYYYGKYVGQVERLTSSTADESVLSPLSLSYCSTLIIGVLSTYLFYNKSTKFYKIIGIISIILSSVPFFLGASRGSLFALVIPFILLGTVGQSTKALFRSQFFIIGFLGMLVFLDQKFSSGLLNRFFETSEAIETGSSSAVRVEIWGSSFNQFLNHPILGDKIEVDNWDGYPHNLLIESLQTMGLFGFILLFSLILNAIYISIKIIKNQKKFAWVSVIFLQALCLNMFSGAIFTASWFWTSMALLFSLNEYLKISKDEN
jgi:hypothetical protein